ncbi:MAG: hypothetical protein ACXIVD_10205 [Salinarimonas sp.]
MSAQVITFPVMPQGAADFLAMLEPHQARAFGESTALMSIGGDLATIAERIGSLVPAHGIEGTARQLSAPVPVIAAWAEGARLA